MGFDIAVEKYSNWCKYCQRGDKKEVFYCQKSFFKNPFVEIENGGTELSKEYEKGVDFFCSLNKQGIYELYDEDAIKCLLEIKDCISPQKYAKIIKCLREPHSKMRFSV